MIIPLLPLLVLAVLQGVLEFLPVSSEGQLLLVAVNMYGIDSATALSVTFWLHIGTAVSVVIFYRKDILGPLYQRIHPPENVSAKSTDEPVLFGSLFRFVIIGTMGTILVALPLYFLLQEFVSQLMGETVSALVGALLLVTGIVLYFQRRIQGIRELATLSLKEAFILGLIQGFAVLPGISRSGVTLTYLLLRGVERKEALRLSFLLGVPSVAGITCLDFILGNFFWTDFFILASITIVAFLVGFISLWGLRYTATRVPFWAFCLGLGFLVLFLTIPSILLMPTIPP
ncbi:MAG: undecaprenyl-diphosphate phosphatase [Promethearchaeota archaeon]